MAGLKLFLKEIKRLWKELSDGAIEVLLRQRLKMFKLNGKNILENLTLSPSDIFRGDGLRYRQDGSFLLIE